MSVGLVMIVKDEAPVIARCLESVKPFIDWWVISDTGSTDGTQQIIRDVMDGEVPGMLHQDEWVDFAHNRNRVLEEARMYSDGPTHYVLTIDADELLIGNLDTSDLTDDGYHLTVHYDQTVYQRLALIRLHSPWQWVGPVHEYLDLPDATLGTLESPTVEVHHDGARSRDPETYRKDAALLQRAITDDPRNPRLWFYLAQSWKDADEPEKALTAYTVRMELEGGWEQERWYAAFQVARLSEQLGDDRCAEYYLDAFQMDPSRAEPLVELARFERLRNRFPIAAMYAARAFEIREPEPSAGALFVDTSAYGWRVSDELAVSLFYCGRYVDAAIFAERAAALLPEDPRLAENERMCREAVIR